MRAPTRRRTRLRALAVVTASLGLIAGCGGSGGSGGGTSTASAGNGGGHGTVRVLYAGSLVNMMEHGLGARFAAATGYKYQGFGAGSTEVANQIKGKVRRGDVFISANPKVNGSLEGSANGGWVSWYATFASAPLVIAYNPHSKFAADLKSKPWYKVIGESGFRLGRTDPKLDPKGKLSVQALQQAAQAYHDAGLVTSVEKSAQVFPEEELVGRLEAGQLDAGFFYSNEAAERHLPTVGLGAVKLSAAYTVTVLDHAPDAAGGAAFVRYLLGDQGKAVLTRHGLTVPAPTVTGDPGAIPASLRSVLPKTAG